MVEYKHAMRKRNSLFKANYFKNLNPRDSKKFWKAVKYLNKQQSTIPTLLQGDQIASSDIHKAELLNAFFSSCVNTSHPPLTMLPCS